MPVFLALSIRAKEINYKVVNIIIWYDASEDVLIAKLPSKIGRDNLGFIRDFISRNKLKLKREM